MTSDLVTIRGVMLVAKLERKYREKEGNSNEFINE